MYKFDLLASVVNEDEELKNSEVVEETNEATEEVTEESVVVEDTNTEDAVNTDSESEESSNEEEEVSDESMDVIAFEYNTAIQEMQKDADEFKAILASFKELQDVKVAIENYGIDDLLIEQVGDNLDKIASSFKSKDKEATLAEIEESTEGIIEYIKDKASNLKARWKNGWTKAVKADTKIRQKLDRTVAAAKKLGADVTVPNSKIVAYDYSKLETTKTAIEKIFKKAVALPIQDGDKSLFELWTAEQTKLIESYKLEDNDCLLKYYFDWHIYKPDESQSPEPMSIEESGATSVQDLVKFSEAILASSFGNVKIENEFNKQYDEIIKALRNLPIGQTDVIYNLYDWTIDSVITGFIHGEAILRQYAVQSLIALQGIAK